MTHLKLGDKDMSKIIRSGRLSGTAVTLDFGEFELFAEEKEVADEGGIDLFAMVNERGDAARKEVAKEWEDRLCQEIESLQEGAKRTLEETEKNWRQQLDEARKQRYDEGYQDGIKSKEDEVFEAVARLDTLHGALEAERVQVISDSENSVLDLTCALAHRITGLQAEVDRRVLVTVIKDALGHLGDHSNLLIKVNPEDLKLARRFAQRWVEKVATEAVLKVQASEHVSRGGCMIEGTEENLDARLESQVGVLRAAVHAALSKEEPGEDEHS